LTVAYVIQRGRDLPTTLLTNQVLLFFLRNFNVPLIVVIPFVLRATSCAWLGAAPNPGGEVQDC
jgi:hypothetical protein